MQPDSPLDWGVLRAYPGFVNASVSRAAVLAPVLALVVVSGGCRPPASGARTLNAALGEYGIDFGAMGKAAVIDEFKRQGKKMAFHTLVATNGRLRAELEITSPLPQPLAKRYGASKYAVFDSLYDPHRHPYPGAITTLIRCPKDKKPEPVQVPALGGNVLVLLADASGRYTFGVWQKGLVKHRGAYCVVYHAGSKSLLEVKLFQPSGQFERDAVLAAIGSLRSLEGR